MLANINPFKRVSETSFTSRLNSVPLSVLFANPCTMIADDCTPTLPAIAAMSGVKKNKLACFSIAPSNKPITFTVIKSHA